MKTGAKKTKHLRESFEETSRKLGCDESLEAFERAFASVVGTDKPKKKASGKKPNRSQ